MLEWNLNINQNLYTFKQKKNAAMMKKLGIEITKIKSLDKYLYQTLK